MKSISNLIALLLILGIVIASSVLVSNIILAQVGKGTEHPTHVEVVDKGIIKISESVFKVEVIFYNPSDKVLHIYPAGVVFYTEGFSNSEVATIIEGHILKLKPGESGKMELIAELENLVLREGVVVLKIRVIDVGTWSKYLDVVLITVE